MENMDLNFNDIYRGKKVLVTGNTGFKGSWLSVWLKMLGAEVVGVSNNIPTKPSLYENLQQQSSMHFIDIRDKQALT